jgi:group I intron endonuclease
MEYYTYAYLREDGTPYYIGKGKGRRAFLKHIRQNRTNLKPKDKNKILILKKNLNEEQAIKHEKYMIAVFGRKDLGTGILRNMTNGGDGIEGYSHTQKTKNKLSKVFIGKKNPFYGKKHSPETLEKMREASKNRKRKPHSEDTKRKMKESAKKYWNECGRNIKGENNHFYGKSHNEETLKKLKKPKPHIRGSYWWNNGQIEKRGVECPGDEWVKGRLKK